MAKKILIVDDDKDLVESLSQVLRSQGYEIASAGKRGRRLESAPFRASRTSSSWT